MAYDGAVDDQTCTWHSSTTTTAAIDRGNHLHAGVRTGGIWRLNTQAAGLQVTHGSQGEAAGKQTYRVDDGNETIGGHDRQEE